jgi:hypothetical protein
MALNELHPPVKPPPPWKPLTPNRDKGVFPDEGFNGGIFGKYAAGGALGVYGLGRMGQGLYNLVSLLRLAAA